MAEHHQCLVVLRTPAASHVSEVVCVVEERTGGVLKCPAESVNLNNKTSFVIKKTHFDQWFNSSLRPSLTQFTLLGGHFLTLSAAVHVCLNHVFINKKHFV